MVNKQGQTRLASYYEWFPFQERVALEAEIIRRCLSRTEFQVIIAVIFCKQLFADYREYPYLPQCSFIEYRGYKVIYRRYASLFFVVAVDSDEEVMPRTFQMYTG